MFAELFWVTRKNLRTTLEKNSYLFNGFEYQILKLSGLLSKLLKLKGYVAPIFLSIMQTKTMKFLGFLLLVFVILTTILVQFKTKVESITVLWHEVPTQMLKRKKYARNSRIYNKAFQICLRNRMMCTNNTIPVRRSTIADVMRLNSTSEFKKKQKSFRHQLPIFTENHEYASVVYDAVQELYGVAGAIKMATPLVSGENGCSQAHVQIKTGSGQDFESITVGWHRDGYQTTKCYNYECNGFVAENDEDNEDNVVLGDELEPSPAHPDIYVKIWKDPVRQIWSLMIDDEVTGEWRRDIFPRLGGIYTSVEWGGEVSNNRTQMGSGRFENEEGACYIRNLEIMTSDNPHHPIQVPFEELTERETNPELYNVSIKHNRRYIYFGGPGLTA
ncbi:uncharacterized protein LOC119987711 [Tripterygium wilfordii]|uniref:uncharacterized protein LOC119987711 n=1 Tax=Tripterygium wilfordii TaxID=458696 RepID=UPI0018F7FA4F|nr:uncharacterized protein LOC119987711 [Tripterygium wilfordii]